MGFYYLNVLSLLFLALIYAVAIFLFWFFWVKGLGRAFSGPLMWLVVATILIAPWIEEFWIAYHFGQACKEAGTFIYKKVEVDGYYDDTGGGAMTRLVGGPRYKFIESRESDGKFRRVERASAEEKASALSWYSETHSGSLPGAKEWITHPVNDGLQVTVEMDTGYAWRITRLDQPTARYHYNWPYPYGIPVVHKIVKTQTVVIDTENNEQIARYTGFGRSAPWFWIGLDTPEFACDAPSRWPLTKGSTLVYRDVLIPAAQR